MADFNHPDKKAKFTLPDKPTIRQVLVYDNTIEMGRTAPTMYVRLWTAALPLIQDWQSETVKLDIDLDGEYPGEESIEIIEWAGLAVFSWRLDLKSSETVAPKN